MTWGLPFLEYAVTHGACIKGKPMRWDLTRVCDRLGIPRVSSNDLRRTYSQWMRQAGIDPHLIGPAMGHADSRMVETTYGRLPPDKLIRLISATLH